MLPTKKLESSNLSLPVSRVSSSQRLSQLNSSTAYNSIPGTPLKYLSSSLNPTRNSSNTPHATLHYASQYPVTGETIPVIENVKKFEETFVTLTNNISTFKDQELVENINVLINLNNEINSSICDLGKHQKLGKELGTLKKDENDLNQKAKILLKELLSYHTELKKLPRIPNFHEGSQDKDIEVREILKYALKLSKFTKAPPTVANAPYQIHPNNYIWPAEDALRRGNLAISSIRSNEIISEALGGEIANSEKEPEHLDNHSAKSGHSSDNEGSDVVRKSLHTNSTASDALDIDLFDPDEEQSD
ncbi:uncharacterized protein PRCAT00001637001 [Priceomyces carsonii]|uniref:uncharacterized protein n=1 Tax=Priceomyces carsonii TaxID=28549 RepID=UPI002EDA6041|nr:unnamed protein product [Priceomyces carsonii]